jgi:F-box-like
MVRSPDVSSTTVLVSMDDVFSLVVCWLDAKSCARVSSVSKFWRSCADDPSLWKIHVLRRLIGGALPVESRTGLQIRCDRGSVFKCRFVD